ncbi:LysR family transcriptional regulator [Cupriavidus basilensis OR16]|uniref:LysR family transcriptional regulator n=1 Tax=Cupriavidus basilensis OR16 TaxID=1127483 RepID=H1RYJ6_9BURK|nr:LysR family transcriptional regulator [Cupriavidus basilensis]EHP44687.1 LysR family transcriptional regulator [Cupriavidus basilensis OR16]
MNVTLRQMRAFVEVARSGGFTAAAPKLHLTQSATSLQIRELESQLGLQLIDRSTRRFALTDAGNEFLISATRIVADVEQSVADTRELVHKRRGRITVATTPLLASTLLPDSIAEFLETYPAVTVRVADLPAEQIGHRVLSGDVDFGFGVFPQADPQFDRIPLLRHPLGVMVPSTWPLATRRRDLTWSDLQGQPLIAMSHSTGIRTLIDQYLHQAGVQVNPRFEVEYLGTAVGLAQAGLGIAVVPAYVGMLLGSSRVLFRPLYKPVVHRQIELIVRAGRSLSPSAEAFRDCLAARCEMLHG